MVARCGLAALAVLASLELGCAGGGGGTTHTAPPAPGGTAAAVELQALSGAIATDGRASLAISVSSASGAGVGGVAVHIATTIGTLEQADLVTGPQGQASTALRGAGARGVAVVTVKADGVATAATAEIQVGQGLTLELRSSPPAIPSDGVATLELLALDPQGRALSPGTLVAFSTTLGRLETATSPIEERAVAANLLHGDGRRGTAVVGAQVVGFAERATVAVPIGPAR